MGDLKLNLARPRRYVEETFSIENMVRQCIALHQEAAESPAGTQEDRLLLRT